MQDESTRNGEVSQGPPTLEYATAHTEIRPRLRWWLPFVAVLLAFFAPVCACGHYDLISLPFTIPALGLACYAWIGNKHRNIIWRAVLILVVILISILVLQNIADVLWFGHNALLR